MTARTIIAISALLLLLLGAEIGLARLHLNILAAPMCGVVMAGIVTVTFMQLGQSAGLPRIFAMAGLFWLVVLLGMGSLDPLTRYDMLVKLTGERNVR